MKVPSQGAQIDMMKASQSSSKKGASAKGGERNIGDIANQLTDPNFSANNKLVKGVGNPKLDKDSFFKLMLTQVKNQDPTNPLKSHEMAAQLAQFSSLEQMSNIKELLGEMNANQAETGQYKSLNLIGKTVSGDISKIQRSSDDVGHDIAFNLGQNAKEIKVSIRNDQGKVIREMNMKDQLKGQVKLNWDGKDVDGRKQKAGSFRVSIQAHSEKGSIPIETQFKGTVSGVKFTDNGAMLMVGNRPVPLADIKRIDEPQKPQAQGGLNQKAAQLSNKVKAAGTLGSKGAMPSVMSPQMVQNLNTALSKKL